MRGQGKQANLLFGLRNAQSKRLNAGGLPDADLLGTGIKSKVGDKATLFLDSHQLDLISNEACDGYDMNRSLFDQAKALLSLRQSSIPVVIQRIEQDEDSLLYHVSSDFFKSTMPIYDFYKMLYLRTDNLAF